MIQRAPFFHVRSVWATAGVKACYGLVKPKGMQKVLSVSESENRRSDGNEYSSNLLKKIVDRKKNMKYQ